MPTDPGRVDALAALLGRVLGSPAAERRLTVTRDGVWAIVCARASAPELGCHLPSTAQLPGRRALDVAQASALRAAGFHKGGELGGFHRTWPAQGDQLAALARVLLELLGGVYAVDTGPGLEVSFVADDLEHPTNPALVEAMRAYARARDEPTRRATYRALVNATLLVPLVCDDASRWDLGDEAEIAARLVEAWARPGRSPGTLSAFSDWPALWRAHPLGPPYLALGAAPLIEALARARQPWLDLNPAGPVGGRLVGGELAWLAEGIGAARRPIGP